MSSALLHVRAISKRQARSLYPVRRVVKPSPIFKPQKLDLCELTRLRQGNRLGAQKILGAKQSRQQGEVMNRVGRE